MILVLRQADRGTSLTAAGRGASLTAGRAYF